jgi:hypothetical protein
VNYATFLHSGAAMMFATGLVFAASQQWPAPALLPPAAEAPARLIIAPPLPEQLALGRVLIQYRAENVRFVPVYGQAGLSVSPRIGHIHITVDDATWHWLDASGEPLSLVGLLPGPHRVLIELADATHKVIDSKTIAFEIPKR